LRQQFNSKRYNIVSKNLSSHCLAAPAADLSEHPRSEGGTRSPLRVAKIQAAKPHLFGIAAGRAADPPSKMARRRNFAPFVTSSSAKEKLCLRRWSEHSRSEGGTRSPLRVAKIYAAKPQLFGISNHSMITIERFRNR
jgi:hypothetical protein